VYTSDLLVDRNGAKVSRKLASSEWTLTFIAGKVSCSAARAPVSRRLAPFAADDNNNKSLPPNHPSKERDPVVMDTPTVH
jgi:hypothetical protein